MIKKNRSNDRKRNEKSSDKSGRSARPSKFKGGAGGRRRKPGDPDASIEAQDRAKQRAAKNIEKSDGMIRLNKYIADAGVCSRREADRLIESGAIKVNEKVVSEVGVKVRVTDKVQLENETLSREALMYVLLNKPKDYITTTDDPQNRRTVMSLIENACKERIYPVGRLDRNTTGLLLFTNDGELSKRLLHPRHKVKKLYHATLDKPITKNDIMHISEGVKLEDGFVDVDSVSYVTDAQDRREVGIGIHSGQNRVVRRIFAHFGYEVKKLDRVIFGPLTKKDIPRGRWRYLTDKEILMLKKF